MSSRPLVLILFGMMLISIVFATSPPSVAAQTGTSSPGQFDLSTDDSHEESVAGAHLMTEQEMLGMRERIGVRQPGVDYNMIVDGHGTGLAPPTAEEWESMVGKVMVVDAPTSDGLSLPTSYDISSQTTFPAVGNQKSQGSCAAWAATYYAYGYLEAKDNGWTDAWTGTNKAHLLSPAWTYNKVNGGVDHGSWMGENIDVSIDWGTASLATHPYSDTDLISWGSAQAFREAPLHRAADYQVYDLTGNEAVNQVKSMISQDRPITFAINAGYYDFDHGDFIVTSIEYVGTAQLNHAQTVVGYNDSVSEDGEVGAFRVVNSWGAGWGEGGYYWITYEAFKEICGNMGQALTEVFDRPDYSPSLLATWHHDSAPARNSFTVAIGTYPSHSAKITPFFEIDPYHVLPAFMCLDVSDFRSAFDAGSSKFWIEFPSGGTASLDSFKFESYEGGYAIGAPTQVSKQSSDIPTILPGHASLSFWKYPIISTVEALDHPDAGFSSYGQVRWTGVNHTSFSGGSSMQSGDVADGYYSTLQTTISGASGVSFYWKVSSESDKDVLRFYVDSVLKETLSGDVDWTKRTFTFSGATHVLRWNYSRDSANCGNKDTAWVDKIVIIPQDDVYEENDAYSQATSLAPTGTYFDLVGLDDDWYGVDIWMDDKLTVRVDLNNSQGDLDLYLYDRNGTTLLSSSVTSGNQEQTAIQALSSGTYYVLVRLGTGTFARYSITFIYESGALDYGKNSSLAISSGTASFASVMPGKSLTVVTGSTLSGTIILRAAVSWSDSETVPLIATTDWGSPEASYSEVTSDLANGATDISADVALTAPSAPGTYYLIFAFRNESSAGHVASATSHLTGAPAWEDGNDICSFSEAQIAESRTDGRTLGNWLRLDGMHAVRIPSDALELNVVPPDLTPPITSLDLEGTSGSEGWYRSEVTLALIATDVGGAGVSSTWYRLDSGSWTKYLAPIEVTEVGLHSISFYSVDGQDNQEPVKSASFGIDFSPPSTTAILSGTLGDDGWYISEAILDLNASDPLSGVQISYYRLDGGSWRPIYTGASISTNGHHLVDYYSIDLAGNIEPAKQVGVKVDRSPPVSSVQLSGAKGSLDWYLGQVQVTVASFDSASGVASQHYSLDGGPWLDYLSPLNVTGQGQHTIQFNSTDEAGNVEGPQTQSFWIDSVAPSSTILLNGSLGNDGWYLSAVDITINAEDSLSGLQAILFSIDDAPWENYSTKFVLSEPGAHIIRYRALDIAGNLEEPKELQLWLDNSPPLSDLDANGILGSLGWYISDVELSAQGFDQGSGIVFFYFRLDGGAWSSMDEPLTLTEEGEHLAEVYAVDLAGNTGPVASRQVNIDTSPAVSSIFANGSQGEDGWFVSMVEVELLANDNWSGPGTSYYSVQGSNWTRYSSAIILGEEGIYDVLYYSVDLAGNLEVIRNLQVKVDLAGPVSSLSLHGDIGREGWFVSQLTAELSASDPMSGPRHTLYRLDEGPWETIDGAIIIGDGIHVLEYYSIDKAGNREQGRSQELWVDTLAPTTLVSINGEPGMGQWLVSPLNITLIASDSGSGPYLMSYRIDEGAWFNYSSPFSLGEEGVHLLSYFSTDMAGNVEEMGEFTLMMDLNAPITTALISGRQGTGQWYVSEVDLSLSATDQFSGIQVIELSLDGDEWSTYLHEVSVNRSGDHILEYRSLDAAGNIEQIRTIAFQLDLDAPSLEVKNVGRPFTTSLVELQLDPKDAVSSISEVRISVDGGAATMVDAPWTVNLGELSDGWHDAKVTVIDQAGNNLTQDVRFKVDTNPLSPEGPYGPWLLIALVAIVIGAFVVVLLSRKRKRREGV